MPFPEINAGLNALATVFLTTGFILIRMGKRHQHRIAMTSAFVISVLFLISYVTSKIIRKGMHTHFAGEGVWVPIYYSMLVSHIILAIVIVPLVLRTLYLAANERFGEHRRWARWTFPLWYYVSVTGVLVYFFLFKWFPHT